MTLTIIILIANQIACMVEAYLDVRKEKKGLPIKHAQSALFRAIAWIAASILLNLHFWPLAALFAPLLGFQYWLTFDYMHNLLKKQDWFYGNSTGFFDSILAGKENRWRKLMVKLSLVFYIGLIYFLINEHLQSFNS
jgi:hypothetical protein